MQIAGSQWREPCGLSILEKKIVTRLPLKLFFYKKSKPATVNFKRNLEVELAIKNNDKEQKPNFQINYPFKVKGNPAITITTRSASRAKI